LLLLICKFCITIWRYLLLWFSETEIYYCTILLDYSVLPTTENISSFVLLYMSRISETWDWESAECLAGTPPISPSWCSCQKTLWPHLCLSMETRGGFSMLSFVIQWFQAPQERTIFKFFMILLTFSVHFLSKV
jgi:hypothetical protein